MFGARRCGIRPVRVVCSLHHDRLREIRMETSMTVTGSALMAYTVAVCIVAIAVLLVVAWMTGNL